MERIITSHRHHYRIFISALIALAFLGVMVAMSHRAHAESTAPAANEHIITLHDDGVDRGFITKQSTIRDALKDAGIRLDANDRTEPSLDEKLVASSYQVNIYRARPVVIRDGSAETKIVTSYRTGKQIAKQANITLNDADNVELDPSRDPIADGAAEVMTITRATAFTFIFYGKTETSHTLARTVGEMLKEKNITMGKADGISPSLSTPISEGMTVKLWRDGTQTVTVEEDVAFTTKQIKDADRERGYKDIQTKGENGRRTVTYEINTQNGVEVSRKEINANVTKQPVEQVEVIGTKVNLPAGSHEDWMAAAGIAPGDYGYVNFIVGKEGGWCPTRWQGDRTCVYHDTVTPNGLGYGLVQATPGTKMSSAGADWLTNPITQLKWANGYAVGRYGSWGAAYEFWVANRHW